MAEPSSSSSRHTTPQRQRQKTAEVWDEDFEFPTITIPKGKGKEVETAPSAAKDLEDGEESPVEDWDLEDLDASPPAGPSRLPSPTTAKRKSPESLGLARLSLGSPRASSSQSADLPLPRSPTFAVSHPNTSASGSALQLVPDTSQDVTKQRARSGSTTRNKLIKRHPSTSFIPLVSSVSSDSLAASAPPLPVSRSSYDVSKLDAPVRQVHRSKSGEQMPPPPLPTSATHARAHSRTRISSRPTSRSGEIRVSAIPLSPSNEQSKDVEVGKKPGFWKRLSGQPFIGEPKTAPGTCESSSEQVQAAHARH